MEWAEAFAIVGVMLGFAAIVWAAAWASSKTEPLPPLEPYEPKWPWTWEPCTCQGCGKPIVDEANYVPPGRHSASGPFPTYHEACYRAREDDNS